MNRRTASPFNICIFLALAYVLFFDCSSLQAQSSKELRAAFSQLNETLISTTKEIRVSAKAGTKDLKVKLLESLETLNESVAQVVAQLDTIQTQQDKKLNNTQLYCTIFLVNGSLEGSNVEGCFLANNFSNKLTMSIESIQAGGWHLSSIGGPSANRVVAVYSKYVE